MLAVGSAPAAAQGPVEDLSDLSDLSDMAAREVARAAQLDLLRVRTPGQADFSVAADVLAVAHGLAPKNEQILRFLIEAASQGGTREDMAALSRELLALDSGDTVAQLRVISAAVGALQNVDDRLAAYENYLGPRGRALDPSVRSRLALDSALLLREHGDLRGFADRLSLATELDPTNKDAASLAVTFFTQRVDDAVGRFELLENLLLADPFDPETHLALARELSSGGAWAEAQRFYGLYSTLLGHFGQRLHEQIAAESIVARWNDAGAASVLRELRSTIEAQREKLRQIRTQLEAAGQPLDGVQQPEDIRLSASVERVRLIAAAALGDAGQLEYARKEYLDGLRRQEQVLTDPALRPEGMTEEQAQQGLMVIRAEAAWTFLWAGFNIDEAAQIIGAQVEEVENPEAQARYRGFLLLRQGDLAGGRMLLEQVRPSQPLALVGLAIAEELEGRPQGAAAICADLATAMPGSLAGAWARTRHEVLTGQPAPLPEGADRLREIGQATPSWLDAMVRRPIEAVHLRTTLSPDTINVLGGTRLTVSVKNTSRIALGVGPEKVVNSRLLLSPQIQVGVAATPPADLSTVLSAERRLRLMPGDEYSIEVDPMTGLLGAVMHELSGRSVRVRWRVLQGFSIAENGAYTRSPLGQATQTPMLYRPPSRWADSGAPQLEEWIRTGSARDIAEAVCVLRWRQGEGEAGALPEDEMLALGRAIAERYPQLERAERLLVTALLPFGGEQAWLAPVDEALAAEQDADVALIAVVVRGGPQSPVSVAALASEDGRVRGVAERMQARGSSGRAESPRQDP